MIAIDVTRNPPRTTYGQRHRRNRALFDDPKALDNVVRAALDPLLQQHGFLTAKLITNWSDIVGRHTDFQILRPLRLGFLNREQSQAVLHLSVPSALAIKIQHQKPLLIDLVNGFLGYGLIVDIALFQDFDGKSR